MREAKYVIYGDPVPLARIRFGRRRAYDKQRPLKREVAANLRSQHEGPLFTGPLSVQFIFYMPIPESYSLKRQRVMPDCYHHKRPDLSNLIKFVEDVANEIVINDDSIISEINAVKLYAPWEQARTEMYIKSVKVYESKEKYK